MEPTPDGEAPEGSGRPSASAPPPGAGATGAPGDAPFAAAPSGPAQPGPPTGWPAPTWAQPGTAAAFAAPARPQPVDRTPVVWTAVGAAALISVATFTICALLVVAAPPAEQQQSPPAAADPARHTSTEFSARPAPVEVDIDDHPAYDLAMPEQVACDVPDLDPESSSSWEAFSSRLSDCLGRLWQPRLKHLGLRTSEPEFRISHTDPDSGSGAQGSTLAYYEHDPMSVTVVLPNVTELAGSAPDGGQEAVWSALLAHEYGHHVQELTGILDVSTALESEAPTEQARMEQLRRTELQAECLAGVGMQGLRGFDEAEIEQVNEFLNSGMDLESHGSAGNRRRWFAKGTTLDTIGGCNTYAAPETQVE